ncbi:hypothetical protein NQ166_08295 [Microbacterium sp. zg.Y1090]|uniref:hypothetical protein n=1 Tax=Microbacterium wangruii TaxID=3049073 RepID=UPI00214DE1C3|nr:MULTISPECIES: hypothetical protein [unclassified Microbacterium]MCR2818829.1 hypothetical protein [Microbacterium sp. zg.Y1090]MDL5486920.1 hypothetical protein [Microbacterium sp. zg-Y1211]WIM27142.1 hypothetical protein QNO26_08105 [Microbacterium sp. zg-Y1090]
MPTTTQDALVDKLLSGEPLDSMTGAAPVSTNTTVESGFEVTENVYADGSVSINRIEIAKPAPAPGTITPFGVSGCSTSNGSGVVRKTNCLIDRWDGIVQQNFRADFTFVNNGYDRIDSIYSQSSVVYGARSWKQESFSIGKRYENASGPARAEYRISADTVLGTFSYGLGLRVGANIGGQQYTF